MSNNKFNYDGNSYEVKPKPKKIRRRTMFDKDYVSLELILVCVGSAVVLSTVLIYLMKWLG